MILEQEVFGVKVKGILAIGGGFSTIGALIYLGLKTGNKEAIGALIGIANMIFGFYFGQRQGEGQGGE